MNKLLETTEQRNGHFDDLFTSWMRGMMDAGPSSCCKAPVAQIGEFNMCAACGCPCSCEEL